MREKCRRYQRARCFLQIFTRTKANLSFLIVKEKMKQRICIKRFNFFFDRALEKDLICSLFKKDYAK